jgi:5-methylcytosine-specific restriction enzyme A
MGVMAYWVLQANPDIYDVPGALRDAGHLRTWTIPRHRHDIGPGDEFALWVSGRDSGVRAFGTVTEAAEYAPGDPDPHWKDAAEGNRPTWRVGIRVEDILDTPIPRAELSRDPDFAAAAIMRMPGGGNPFPLTETQWQAMRSHRASRNSQQAHPGRNPPWARDELLLALDLYLRRRPHLPGADDPEVRELSAFLSSLPIHTVRPDLERFRNPNGVALKLANFAALDPQYPGAGMRAGGRLDAIVWDRYTAEPDRLRQVVEAIRDAASAALFPSIPEADEGEYEAEEGRLLTRLHRVRERNAALIKRKKEAVRRARGELSCEVCGFDFARTYGPLGAGFIEAHHILPLAEAGTGNTKLADLALVCSNCHRMLHRAKPWITPAALHDRLAQI